MDLVTGQMIRWTKVTPCPIIRMIFYGDELLAKQKWYKSLKLFTRKKKEILLENADLIAGVGGNVNNIIEVNIMVNLLLA